LINQIATSAISLSLFRGVLHLDIIKLIVLSQACTNRHREWFKRVRKEQRWHSSCTAFT